MYMKYNLFSRLATATTVYMMSMLPSNCAAQQVSAPGVGKWLTVSANISEAGYRRTQFSDPHYDTSVFQWDSRGEIWLPPFRDKFSWGPYVRLAGIAGSRNDAWQNAFLAAPGIGFQVYPLSYWRFQSRHNKAAKLFGPLRFFAEYSRTNYWGTENRWRPRSQSRIGFEYWKAVNVNEPSRYWWVEIWNGLYWQSSNEFTDKYNTVILANAWRSGIRKTHSGILSTITPYLAFESSRTKYDYTGNNNCTFAATNSNPCDFYWENRFLVGGGLRFAPSLIKLGYKNRAWLTRFVVYGEYLNTAAYYGPTAPSSVPRFDFRVGLSVSIGQWYK